MRAFLKKIYFAVAYRLYARRKMHRTDTFRYGNFTLTVQPGVFHPQLFFTSRFLSEFVASLDLNRKTVLDLGCGSGILSLCAARNGACVTSIDINEEAVTITAMNATQNNLSQSITAIRSDMFTGLTGAATFNIILVNPPFYKKNPLTIQEHAWYAGKEYEYFHSFGKQARAHLKPDGAIYMILSTDGDIHTTLNILNGHGLKIKEVASKKVLFETLKIFEMR